MTQVDEYSRRKDWNDFYATGGQFDQDDHDGNHDEITDAPRTT